MGFTDCSTTQYDNRIKQDQLPCMLDFPHKLHGILYLLLDSGTVEEKISNTSYLSHPGDQFFPESIKCCSESTVGDSGIFLEIQSKIRMEPEAF